MAIIRFKIIKELYMKKMLFMISLFPVLLFSQSFLISNIPISKSYVQNLDPYRCDENCLQEYLDNDMVFSFLSHAKEKLQNEKQDDARIMYTSILNIGSAIITDRVKIAMLLPYKRIGKYASSTTNSSFAYLITRNQSFELKSYKIETEEIKDIQTALDAIENDGFTHVIAPLTSTGVNSLIHLNPSINIFIPTINKHDTNSTSPYLYFGGIDYHAQSDLLIQEAIKPLVIFYDKSALGKKLAQYEEKKFITKLAQDNNSTSTHDVIKYSISRGTTNLQKYLDENEDIQLASFFINTPIVKTSMIMSQLTLYDANATNILSTQINYDPLILSMTQYADRKDMIIANSITKNNNVLIETNALLSNDIKYDWINYTTTVGIDYFFNKLTNIEREYKVSLVNNQMVYDIELVKPSLSKFKIYSSAIKKGED
jgi:hypothetical protein